MVLVPAYELKTPTWEIRLHGETLHIQRLLGVPGGVPEPITFDSFDKARAFVVWLNKVRVQKINGRALMLFTVSLELKNFDPADSGQLEIVRRDEKCDSAGQALSDQKDTK